MSHYEQLEFIKIISKEIKILNKYEYWTILDIGSYDVNGTVKKIFPLNKYLGIDLAKGPNVDIVLNGDQLDKLKKKFNIVISTECFEHAKNYKDIFLSMYNVCEDDGYVIFTCASRGRIEHGTNRSSINDNPSSDGFYYKNVFKEDFERNFNLNKLFNKYFLFYNIKSSDLYFVGGKKIIKNIINFDKIINETEQIQKPGNGKFKKFSIQIILSYLLSDKNYQNFIFVRKKFFYLRNLIKSYFLKRF
jgi:hypothetical protein